MRPLRIEEIYEGRRKGVDEKARTSEREEKERGRKANDKKTKKK